MATRDSIWRGAFGEMTGGRLQSVALDANNEAVDRRAGPISVVYPSIVSAALTRIYWPWTLHRITLTGSKIPDPDSDFDYSVEMPAAADGSPTNRGRLSAGPLEIYSPPNSNTPYLGGYAVRGTTLFFNVEKISILYQRKTPEPTWTEQFAEYVRLLIMTATVGTYGDPDLIPYYRNLAEAMFAQAAGSTQEVDGLSPKSLITHFQTTSLRQAAGYGSIEPIATNSRGQALPEPDMMENG